MVVPADSHVVQSIRAHRRGELTLDQATRAVAEHGQYWMPVPQLAEMGFDISEQLIVFDQDIRLPKNWLWIYTDEQRTHLAAAKVRNDGFALGVYAGPIDGARVLAELADGTQVAVNHGCDPEEATYFEDGNGIREWGRGVLFERSFAARDATTWAAMENHVWFLFATPDLSRLGNVRLPGDAIEVVTIFTNEDCVDKLFPKMRDHGFRVVRSRGSELFSMLAESGFEFVVNVSGPGPNLRGNCATRTLR